MTIGRSGTKNFDPETCFKAWLEYGTVDKAKKALLKEGLDPHPNTIRRNAFIYIIDNPEEVRELMKNSGIYYAYNDTLWNDFLIRKAKAVLVTQTQSFKSFYSWLELNNLLEEAKERGYIPPNFTLDSVL